MSDTIIIAIAHWGVPLLAVVTFLSCLALPVPASLAMLATGAFTASGDITLASAAFAALVGAVLGDQAGFLLARSAADPLTDYIATRPKRRALLERARGLTDRHGGPGIFFSRWLVSPLGPYANFAAGLIRMPHLRFTLWGIAGEVVWVTFYTGIGRLFADRIDMVVDLVENLSGLVLGGALMALTAIWMAGSLRKSLRNGSQP
ncbi:MAG: DedA family protein [Pseudooceanicola sp.]